MSLATRCTSCGTVFRVVQDQLKVSEGWVRCGRCDAVINAIESLFDLEHEAPPPWQPGNDPPPVAPPARARTTGQRPAAGRAAGRRHSVRRTADRAERGRARRRRPDRIALFST